MEGEVDMAQSQSAVEIFCLHAPEDENYLEQLDAHLAMLQKQELVSFCDDRRILAGEHRTDAIDEHLRTASIILLLISADFLASKSLYRFMELALEQDRDRNARVIPIIVGPCDWKITPLARLQNLPRNSNPISEWESKDKAWNEVVEDIRLLIEDMSSRDTSQSELPADTGSLIDPPVSSRSPHVPEGQQKRRGIVTWVKPKPWIIVVVALIVASVMFISVLRTTTIPVSIPLQVISQPHYAKVGGILILYSSYNQNIDLSISFINNGKTNCTGVKFHALDISNSSGQKSKPISSIDQSWNLRPTVPLVRSVQFQLPSGSGSQYTLTFSLDVGGCTVPHDNSPYRYANYQGDFLLINSLTIGRFLRHITLLL